MSPNPSRANPEVEEDLTWVRASIVADTSMLSPQIAYIFLKAVEYAEDFADLCVGFGILLDELNIDAEFLPDPEWTEAVRMVHRPQFDEQYKDGWPGLVEGQYDLHRAALRTIGTVIVLGIVYFGGAKLLKFVTNPQISDRLSETAMIGSNLFRSGQLNQLRRSLQDFERDGEDPFVAALGGSTPVQHTSDDFVLETLGLLTTALDTNNRYDAMKVLSHIRNKY